MAVVEREVVFAFAQTAVVEVALIAAAGLALAAQEPALFELLAAEQHAEAATSELPMPDHLRVQLPVTARPAT